jgi:hypothetical protein
MEGKMKKEEVRSQNPGVNGSRWVLTVVTLVTLSAGLTPTATAQCGASMVSKTAPVWRNIPQVMSPMRTEPKAADIAIGEDPSAPAGIAGMWIITFTSGGQVVDQGFDVWHRDGTEMLNDTPPPATGNICLGIWSPNGYVGFKLYHPSWTFDESGNLSGTAIIRENVALDPKNRNRFSGTFTVDIYDLTGTKLAHIDGTVAAQRIVGD